MDASDSEWKDERVEPEEILTREVFFSRLEPGDVVQATGNQEKDIDSTDCTNLRLLADEVDFENDDDVFGTVPPGGDDNPDNVDDEIVGSVSNINDVTLTFDVAGQTVRVTDNTLIDSSIIEAARGVEVINDEEFGGLTENLTELLSGLLVATRVTVNGDDLVATSIEDVN